MKKVSLEEQKAQKEDRFLRERQIAFMVYDYFRVTGAHDTVLDYADYSLSNFTTITSKMSIQDGMKLCCLCQRFHPMMSWKVCTNCEHVTLSSSELYWNCTTWRFIRRYRCPIIKKLNTMVKRSINQKLRLRNFDARHQKIETGAVVKNLKGLSGVEGGKGTCQQWKDKGQCSQGDRCSFRHETQDRAQKPEPKAATPSEPSMTRGRSESRKRSVRGRSQTEKFN